MRENLSIGNTFFDKPDDKLWTHRSVKAGGVECLRQIDYIIVGTKDRWRLQNVNAEEDLYIGNDHRTVAATFRIKRTQARNNKSQQNIETPANLKSWEPTNKDEYAEALDKHIITKCSKPDWKPKSNSDKVDALEKILIHTAVQHTKPKKADEPKNTIFDIKLRVAI